ncbi:soluble lytic murein transglycosylase-like protein [Bradyrhizobium japonicum]
MQINPDTFAQLQQEHPELRGRSASDPATNTLAASYLMKDFLNQYSGNVALALYRTQRVLHAAFLPLWSRAVGVHIYRAVGDHADPHNAHHECEASGD